MKIYDKNCCQETGGLVQGYNHSVKLIVGSISLSNNKSTIEGQIVIPCEIFVHYNTSLAAETNVPVLTFPNLVPQTTW